jgi:flagellar hook protein FlgE
MSFDSIYTSTSGLVAQTLSLTNISANLANTQTTAYKTTGTHFEDLLSVFMPRTDVVDGVQGFTTFANDIQGGISTSSSDTSMAISGDGYFTVQMPVSFTGSEPVFDGTLAYTRRGDFIRDGNGFLVNSGGYYLMGAPVDLTTGAAGSGLEILQFDETTTMPATDTTPAGTLDSVSVGEDGQLVGSFSNGLTADIATLPLVTFPSQNSLLRLDGGAYSPTLQSGAAVTGASGTVVGNALEASNTDVTTEATALLATQQAYSTDAVALTTGNQMLQTLVDLKT